MKSIIKIYLLLFSIMINAQIQNLKTETFNVKGNCEMCKEKIEKTSTENSISHGIWEINSHILTLHYDSLKTSPKIILKKIAEIGYDNELFKVDEKAYKKLPNCCLYTRDKTQINTEKNPFKDSSKKDIHQGHNQTKESENKEVQSTDLQEIKVTKKNEAITLSKKNVDLTYKIDSKELLKAACCNLSESFQTNSTVDVNYSNAVTGTKQLKMLGLDQKYTSFTQELLPNIRGLEVAYGTNFIPGRWISGIQLTKGGSTVTNGYEGFVGQINTELVKYNNDPKTTLNLYGDIQTRFEGNIVATSKLNEKWNQSILVHANTTLERIDENSDNFMDNPIGKQINLAYLLDYDDLENSGWGSHFGINLLSDNRLAGEMNYNKTKDKLTNNAYGVETDITKFKLWNKTGYIFKGKPYQSIGLMNQFNYYDQNSAFGLKNYQGKQQTWYSNLIFESILGSTNHKYKAGASFMYDKFDELYLQDSYKRTETVPGIFGEYTYSGEKLTIVTGLRSDFHNLAGTQISPKFNLKYDLFPKTIVRISGGKAFRTANIFAENQQYLVSNRKVEIIPNNGNIYNLKPEIAWNYGISLQQEFKLFGRKSSWITDFFRTDFTDQVITDLDNSQKIIFYNLQGKSYANSFQTQFDFEPLQRFEVRLAYKFYDLETQYISGQKEVPFTAKNRGFMNLAYSTIKNDKGAFWSFDTTLQYVGKQRLPDLKNNPEEFRIPKTSPNYFVLNAQISKNFSKKTRIYVGADNLLSYKQENPIIDVKNPFGNYFDASMIYAPIMPANIYLGLDFEF